MEKQGPQLALLTKWIVCFVPVEIVLFGLGLVCVESASPYKRSHVPLGSAPSSIEQRHAN